MKRSNQFNKGTTRQLLTHLDKKLMTDQPPRPSPLWSHSSLYSLLNPTLQYPFLSLSPSQPHSPSPSLPAQISFAFLPLALPMSLILFLLIPCLTSLAHAPSQLTSVSSLLHFPSLQC